MTNIDAKIEKICKELERDFNAQIVRGKVYKIKEKITIPISIKKISSKKQKKISYSLPVGLIQISGTRVEFVPIEQKHLFIKMIIKIIVVFLGILGFKKLFSSQKKWDTE